MTPRTAIHPRADAPFAGIVSWAERWEAFRDTALRDDCLRSILSECGRNPAWTRAVEFALDGDASDLDWLIAEQDRDEAEGAVAYGYEVRTGREWADSPAREAWLAECGL
jgi:hypothetical protein